MLVNAKAAELAKYSKGPYEKDQFISKASELWEWTDKQIRMIYLISDLAINGQGAFSVSNNSFREMFAGRFKMTISRSTVIRFFQLLEELGLLTVNEARRKNRKQSANIFIMEPIEQETPVETPDETPSETLNETLDEIHNIAFNKALNKDSNIPLTNTSSRYIIDTQLKEKYPNVPFEQIKECLLSDATANTTTDKQYASLLKFRLENYKFPINRINNRKVIRTELLPSWFDEKKVSSKVEMHSKNVEEKQADIESMLARLRSN